MAERPRDSIPALIAEVLRNAQDLVAKEIALLRAETGNGVREFARSLSFIVAAVILLLAGVVVLIFAAVKALAVVLGSEALAALIVGGAFAAVALALALVGLGKMALENLEPKRTERELQRDATIVREHTRR